MGRLMNNRDRDKAAGQAAALWKSGNPIGRILATIILLFLGPLGWLAIVVMWGIHFLDKKN